MPPQRTERSERASPESAAAKVRKMRKGTHSCFECRRRKIRCIFPNDNPDVCTECFARGSKCIDQEHASADAIVDQRKNLRERVSRLESLIETLLDEREGSVSIPTGTLKNLRGEPFPHSPPSTDSATQVDGAQDSAPVLSLFNNDVLSRADPSELAASENIPLRAKGYGEGITANGTYVQFECGGNEGPESSHDAQSNAAKEKYEQTRRALLAPLPSYDKIVEMFSSNADWWTTFRQKCPGTSSKYPNLSDFATDALTKGHPPQLGILVLGIGISMEMDNIEKYLTLVDREIISEDEYTCTLEGLECLILQAKCYADIGQPRKAWLCYRRGLMFAQLMGLHRNHSMSQDRDSIWWCLYQGDRFISLLLGLPYGIADAHCDTELKGPMADHTKSPFPFLLNISKLAGKVIDRTQGTAPSSLSSALDIDSELERVSTQTPPGWFDIGAIEDDITNSHRPICAAELREKVLSQIAYHQIRVYLHLPFMLQSANNPRYEYSRTTCLNSARDMLRLYHLLRAGTGQPLYECKAVDFLGFTASILVCLGLLGYGRMGPIPNPIQEESDWRMIEISIDIFRQASAEKGGKVAAQSLKVLEMLSMVRNADHGAGCHTSNYAAKIVIPYFGTISVRRGQNFQPPSSASNSTMNTPPSVNSSNSPSALPQYSNPSHRGSTSTTIPTPTSTTSPMSQPPQIPKSKPNNHPSTSSTDFTDPFLVYDGFYMPSTSTNPDPSHLQAQQPLSSGEDDMSTFAGSTNPWGMGAMDIDQDWNWFLNDANSMGLGMAGGGTNVAPGSNGVNGNHNGQNGNAAMMGTYFP